jgi:predicted metal-dependent hydrolase
LKSRWGSCSSKKNLNFNVKLICFREEIIEYVVVHEMSHLIHMNHSKDFWKLVERLLPDYDARRKELKKDIKIPELLK